MGHHYLPQRLLQGFSDDSRNLWTYDLRLGGSGRKLPIKGVANEPRMNLPSVENRLSAEVEGPFNGLLCSIANHAKLKSSDLDIIARYVLTMYRRVPKGRQRSAAAVPHVAETTERAALARIDQLEQMAPSERDLAQRGRETMREIYKRIRSDDPSWLWQSTLMPENFPRAVLLLQQMSWACLEVPQGRQLLIGDAPILFDESRGLLHDNAELIFPITSTSALVATWRVGLRWSYGRLQTQQVKAVNERTVKAADRWIYAMRDEAWIAPMLASRSN